MPGVNSFGHLRACRTSPEALLQRGVISPWGTLLQNSSASLSASSRSHPPGHPQLPAPSLGHTEFLEKCCDQARNQALGVRATPLLLRVLIAAISKGSSGASMLRLQRFPANLLPRHIWLSLLTRWPVQGPWICSVLCLIALKLICLLVC